MHSAYDAFDSLTALICPVTGVSCHSGNIVGILSNFAGRYRHGLGGSICLLGISCLSSQTAGNIGDGVGNSLRCLTGLISTGSKLLTGSSYLLGFAHYSGYQLAEVCPHLIKIPCQLADFIVAFYG